MTEYKKHKGSIYKGFFPPVTDLRSIKLAVNAGIPITANVVSGCFLTAAADVDDMVLSLANMAVPAVPGAAGVQGSTEGPVYMSLENAADMQVPELGKLSIVRLVPGLVIETTEFYAAGGFPLTVGSLVTCGVNADNIAGKLVLAAASDVTDPGTVQMIVGRVTRKPTANRHYGDPMTPVMTILVEIMMQPRLTA